MACIAGRMMAHGCSVYIYVHMIIFWMHHQNALRLTCAEQMQGQGRRDVHDLERSTACAAATGRQRVVVHGLRARALRRARPPHMAHS